MRTIKYGSKMKLVDDTLLFIRFQQTKRLSEIRRFLKNSNIRVAKMFAVGLTAETPGSSLWREGSESSCLVLFYVHGVRQKPMSGPLSFASQGPRTQNIATSAESQ